MNKPDLVFKIIICVAICLIIGFTSGFATASSITGWYQTINKPSFNPPNWIFGPMWTLLYILMGVAAALVWYEGLDRKVVKTALTIFGIQILLNGLWSVLFFGLQNPAIALIEIIVLWVLILICIIKFIKIKNVAGYLMIPYLLWVSFATILNASIWYLN